MIICVINAKPSPSVTITLNDNTGSRSPMGSLNHDIVPLQTVVFGQLDLIIRASSLVEMVNAFIRPSLKSCKGQITQETSI